MMKQNPDNTVLKEVLIDLRSERLLPGLSTGIVIGLMVIILQVSFASLIFSGSLAVHVSRGIGMMLAGTFFFLIINTYFSGIRPVIAIAQDAPVAIYAGVAAAIAAELGIPDSEEAFITVTAGLILSALITGVFFYLVGRFKLAELFRFMPYPVIGGFLAGTGWLLLKGGFKVIIDLPVNLTLFPALFTFELLILWLPGLAYALILFFLLHRFSNFLILPCSLVAVVIIYYLVLWIAGISVSEAREIGLLYRSFSESALWPAFQPGQLLSVQLNLIVKQIMALALIPFISILGLLLNTGGIELASREEYDMNKELRVNGSANIFAGLFGSAPGYNTLSLSVLGIKSGANTRVVGFTSALLVLVTLVFGSSILVLFPKAILGGYLMLLGIFFIYDWLIVTAKKMPRSDYILVLLIFLVISVFGYLQGVLFGLLITVLFFVFRFSRVPLIQGSGNISEGRSSRIRPLPQQLLLARHGGRSQVYYLSGYIFFGSVSGLISTITDSIRQQEAAAPALIILDFKNVTGFDISSVNNFNRLINRFTGQDVHFAFAELPEGFEAQVQQNLEPESSRQVSFFNEREKALQWAENQIIDRESALIGNETAAGRSARDELFESASDQMLRALERKTRVEVLIESCSAFLDKMSIDKGDLVIDRDEAAAGIYMVKSGVIVEQIEKSEGSPTLLRELGPGSMFAQPAAYGRFVSIYNYLAKTAVEVSILDPDALSRIEKEKPMAALEIHRLVIDRFLYIDH